MENQQENQQELLTFEEAAETLKRTLEGLGQVSQLVRASSQYTKVVGSIPYQGTYNKQPMNA